MERRLSDRLDIYFWWFIWLLPLIGATICFFMGEVNTFSDFLSFFSNFKFQFIYDILVDLEELISFTFPDILKVFASYLVSVEIIHVFVDVIIFVPRFCHRFVTPSTYDIGVKGRK